MVKALAARRWQADLDRVEARYAAEILLALRGQYTAFAVVLERHGVDAAKEYVLGAYLNAKIGTIIQRIYLEVGAMMAKANTIQAQKQKALGGQYRDEIMEYFRLNLLNKSAFKVSATTRKRLLDILIRGTEKGSSVDQMVREVEQLDEIKARARTIVRTEVVRAANYGVYLGATRSDYEMEKEWLEIKDHRTRLTHTHAGVGGQKADLNQRFTNGLMFPGDPDGSARETINCRCRMVTRAKRDIKGRPIRKATSAAAQIPVVDRRRSGIADAFARIEALIR